MQKSDGSTDSLRIGSFEKENQEMWIARVAALGLNQSSESPELSPPCGTTER